MAEFGVSAQGVSHRPAHEDTRSVLVGRDRLGPRGQVRLGGPHARIIVPITATTIERLGEEIRALAPHPHDLIEWRADHLLAAGGDVRVALDTVVALSDVPVLVTIRTIDEGGAADLEPGEYAQIVEDMASLGDAVDVQMHMSGSSELIRRVQARGSVVVASAHDFSGTPAEFEVIDELIAMDRSGADVAKVAYRANEPKDLLAVMNAQMWARQALSVPVIAISMGIPGAISRIAGAALGGAATFATVGAASAPGQFSADQVRLARGLMEGMEAPPL